MNLLMLTSYVERGRFVLKMTALLMLSWKHAHNVSKSSVPCFHCEIKGEFNYFVSSGQLIKFSNVSRFIKLRSPYWGPIHLGDLEESRSSTTRAVRLIPYFTSTIMVSSAQKNKSYFFFFSDEITLLLDFLWQVLYSITCSPLVTDLRIVHSNLIPQSVIKPDMRIKLRMEGAVNGHKFVILGDGNGKPYE